MCNLIFCINLPKTNFNFISQNESNMSRKPCAETPEKSNMEFPPGWKLKLTTDKFGKKVAHYYPPIGSPLTCMRQLIIKFPAKNFHNFNKLTGKFEKGHRNYVYETKKKWLPKWQNKAAVSKSQQSIKRFSVGKSPDRSKKPQRRKAVVSRLFSSEPVYLNSIICRFFGFEFSEELYGQNEEFLRLICDLIPSASEQWRWVWSKEENFTQEETRMRWQFFGGIWWDELFFRHVGPMYAHEEFYDDLVREAEQNERMECLLKRI